MLFGDPSQFAVEAQLEPGPEFGPIQGRNLVGRIRVWIGGRAVGRYDEPACWLGPPLKHLEEMCSQLDGLWDPSFEGLSTDAIYDRLDYLVFLSHRDRRLGCDWSEEERAKHERESDGFDRFYFLLHSSEAFDGWKAFLLRPTATHLIAVVSQAPQKVVVSHRFPVEDFESAVAAFSVWLHSEEQRLIPRLR